METKRVRRSAQSTPAPRQRSVRLFNGDSVEVLRQLPDNSVDSVVCDPPYGLSKEPDMAEVMRHWLAGDDYKHSGGGFMGKTWDSFVPGPAIWKECLRVLKPGGHLLAFFGSRTYDMGTLAIRLAGFEIRDQIMWVYGSGFPKSLDVSKAIDKAAGATREVIGSESNFGASKASDGKQAYGDYAGIWDVTAPATDEAKQWSGWGTALKPAHEPICVARKPLAGTVAANVLAHGTGGLNIDDCRIPTEDKLGGDMVSKGRPKVAEGWDRPWMHDTEITEKKKIEAAEKVAQAESLGRWPANFIHDGSNCIRDLFPDAKGQQGKSDDSQRSKNNVYGAPSDNGKTYIPRIDLDTSAARFFYCAKASKADRNYGLSGEDRTPADLVNRAEGSAGIDNPRAGAGRTSGSKNPHPTVKPIALMEWLVRLVTPPGGVVLDPFMGSGSTGIAAVKQGYKFVGVELSEDYFKVAKERITFARSQP